MEKSKGSGSTSLLSKNIKIEGDVRGAENLHVEGRLKGAIKIDGNVFVGQTGVVEAEVEADNVVIQGQITGSVLARKILEIQSSGKLFGDCTAQSMDIKEGAIFEGRSVMLKSAAPAAGAGSVADAAARLKEEGTPESRSNMLKDAAPPPGSGSTPSAAAKLEENRLKK